MVMVLFIRLNNGTGDLLQDALPAPQRPDQARSKHQQGDPFKQETLGREGAAKHAHPKSKPPPKSNIRLIKTS